MTARNWGQAGASAAGRGPQRRSRPSSRRRARSVAAGALSGPAPRLRSLCGLFTQTVSIQPPKQARNVCQGRGGARRGAAAAGRVARRRVGSGEPIKRAWAAQGSTLRPNALAVSPQVVEDEEDSLSSDSDEGEMPELDGATLARASGLVWRAEVSPAVILRRPRGAEAALGRAALDRRRVYGMPGCHAVTRRASAARARPAAPRPPPLLPQRTSAAQRTPCRPGVREQQDG